LTKIHIFRFKTAVGRHIGQRQFCPQSGSGLSDFGHILYENAKFGSNDGRIWNFVFSNFERSDTIF